MKISTDAVLLGALASHKNPMTILDIGTGTGVIALMLAQRFGDAFVTGVELDSEAAEQAEENFNASPFSSRMNLRVVKIQDFQVDRRFDLIVSNPPYFTDHLQPKDKQRLRALHTDELSFPDLAGSVSNLLAEHGEFWVILPPSEMEGLAAILDDAGLYTARSILIQDSPLKKPHRRICAFQRVNQSAKEELIHLKDEKGGFSDTYQKLISGFLLGY
ncbi:methyltransferase [Algoriphagus sp.]|uniref:tRNA1(Val) (adenine(37)-N6)-methyltransferase n=1 Tax=Algoriphagus sp. TaxID=1872435 RepID=UPI0025C41E92|nr:methyltransferase [Algoriphagus sp.]